MPKICETQKYKQTYKECNIVKHIKKILYKLIL